MNLFDFFLLVILFGAGILGYKQGIIVQIASLFATVVSLLLAFMFADDLAPILGEFFGSEDSYSDYWISFLSVDKFFYSVIAFFLIFMVSKILLSFLTILFHRLAKFSFLKWLNRLGGVLLSLLQTFILYVFVVHLMQLLPLQSSHRLIDDSIIAQGLIQLTPGLMNILKDTFLT